MHQLGASAALGWPPDSERAGAAREIPGSFKGGRGVSYGQVMLEGGQSAADELPCLQDDLSACEGSAPTTAYVAGECIMAN